MKNLLLTLLILTLGIGHAACAPLPVTTTNGTSSVSWTTNGTFIATATVTANGTTVIRLMAYGYVQPTPGKTPKTTSPYNIYADTSYAGVKAYFTTNSIVGTLPKQATNQP